MMIAGRKTGYVRSKAEDDPWTYLMIHALMDGLTFQLALDPELDADETRTRAMAVIDGLFVNKAP